MVDLVGITNFVILIGLCSLGYYFRKQLLGGGIDLKSDETQEALANSVLSAVIALGTVEDFKEHREGIAVIMQPLFADAMTGVIEQFNTAMSANLPSEETLLNAQETIAKEITSESALAQVPEMFKPSIKKMFGEDGQFGDNPILGSILMGWLGRSGLLQGVSGLASGAKQGNGPAQTPPTPTTQHGGW